MVGAELRASKAARQIASGNRLVDPGIDPAAIRMASAFEATIRGLSMSLKNAQDSVQMLRSADSALGSLGEYVTRMRELAVQSANGTLSETQRSFLQLEYAQAIQSIDLEARAAQFNGMGLLNAQGGSAGKFDLRLGSNAESSLEVEIGNFVLFRDPTGFATVSAPDTGAALTQNLIVNDTLEGTATNGTLRADVLTPTVAPSSTVNPAINPLRGTLTFSGAQYYAGQTITINRLDDANDPLTPSAGIGNLEVTLARAQGSNILTGAQVATQVARAFSRTELAEFEFDTATANGSSVNFESLTTTGTGGNVQAVTLQSNNWNTSATISPLTVGGVAYSEAVTSTQVQPFSTTPQITTYLVDGQFDAGDRIQFSMLEVDNPGTNTDQWTNASYVVKQSDVYDASGLRLSNEKTIRDNVVSGFLSVLNNGVLGTNVTATVTAGTDPTRTEVILTGTGANRFTAQAGITQSLSYDVLIDGSYSANDVVSLTIAGTQVEYTVGANGAGTTSTDIAAGLAQTIAAAGFSQQTVAAVRAENNAIIVTAGQAQAPTTSTGGTAVTTAAQTLSITSDVDEVELSTVAIGSGWQYGDALTITVNGKAYTHAVRADGQSSSDVASAIADPSLRINGQTLSDFWGVASVSADSGTLKITSLRVNTTGATQLNVSATASEAAIQRVQISGDFQAGDIVRVSSGGRGADYKIPTATSDASLIASGFAGMTDVATDLGVQRVTSQGDTIEVTGQPGSLIGLSASVLTPSGELAVLVESQIGTALLSSNAMTQADEALSKILSRRAYLGSAINRLESAVDQMGQAKIHQSASLSRIADADIAASISFMIAAYLIRESAMAILAQANTSARLVISLLKS